MGGPAENTIIAVICTRVLVLGVWRGTVHPLIPGLVEEGLSEMQNGAGVGDERAGAKDQSRPPGIEDLSCTNPFSDLVQSL